MKKLLLILVLPVFTSLGLAAASPYEIKGDDHVLFYGDSITQHRHYTTFIETYTLTRFPTLNATFTNSGWSGDRVTGGHGGNITTRLNRDLFPFKPSMITIMLGMNDGRYQEFSRGNYDIYAKGLESIVSDIRSKLPTARLTLIQPSPYDDYTRPPRFKGGYNEVLIEYGDFVRKLAKKNNIPCVDLNTPLVEALKKANDIDPQSAQELIKDRVHPSQGGHLIMAGELLKAWNAPALVTSVEINASEPTAKIINTQLSDLTLKADGSLSWTQLDAALPFPLNFGDITIALATKVSDFIQSLNQQPLKVTNLPGNYYELVIDDKIVGTYTREDLAKGINLATEKTPMVDQAMKVHNLTVRHNIVRFDNWRQVEVPFAGSKGLDETVSEMRKGEMAIVKLQRSIAQPVPRHYLLKPTNVAPARGTSVLGSSKVQPPPGYNRTNLARGKPYVSSDPNTNNSWKNPRSLTDGSWETKAGTCFATGASREFPKHVVVDLQAVQTIGCVIAGVPPFGSTKTVLVSLSTDGKTFKKASSHTFTQKLEEKRIFLFDPQPARYIALTYQDKYDERAGYLTEFMFTTELEAYAPLGVEIIDTTPKLKLPDGVSSKNLALNKPYVSSDVNRSRTKWSTTTSLTDGSWDPVAGRTFATGTAALPKHVTIDLKDEQEIACVVLGVPSFGSTKTIEVSLSKNGKKFTKVGEYTFQQNQEEKHVLSFSPQEARYIRLNYPDQYDQKSGGFNINYMFTTEVEAYGPAK